MEKTLSERSCRLLRLRLDECAAKCHADEARQTCESDDRGFSKSVGCVAESSGDLESGGEHAGIFSPSNEQPSMSDGNSLQGVESGGDLESGEECAGFSLDDEQPSTEWRE